MTTKHYIKRKLLNTIIVLGISIFFVILCFIMLGCSNTSYRTIPNAMSEDAQDYPTKYNTMDSPDGRRNPNAQINIFGATY